MKFTGTILNVLFAILIVLAYAFDQVAAEILVEVVILVFGIMATAVLAACAKLRSFEKLALISLKYSDPTSKPKIMKAQKAAVVDYVSYDLPCTALLLYLGQPGWGLVYLASMSTIHGLTYVQRKVVLRLLAAQPQKETPP